MYINLNHLDYFLIIKLKKEKLDKILKSLQAYEIKPIINFLEKREHLFDQIDMSKPELYMYWERFANSWIYDYLNDKFNKEDPNVYQEYTKNGLKGFELPDKDTIENLYKHYLNIYTNKGADSLYSVMSKFANNKKEIPEEFIKKYIKFSDSFMNLQVRLMILFIENQKEVPDEVIQAAAKDDIKYHRTHKSAEELLQVLITQYEDSSMQYSREMEIAKQTLRTLRHFDYQEKILSKESFKTFFYNS